MKAKATVIRTVCNRGKGRIRFPFPRNRAVISGVSFLSKSAVTVEVLMSSSALAVEGARATVPIVKVTVAATATATATAKAVGRVKLLQENLPIRRVHQKQKDLAS